VWVVNADGDHRLGQATLLAPGEDLQFVYVTACDGGSKAAEWEQALAPAEVRTFGRLSAVLEHLLWLWSDGPRRVREME
jgi:hypothetical protein